ncbi:hypothetical protein V1509DRAFT_140395 [Lipomyces kononenkoae]
MTSIEVDMSEEPVEDHVHAEGPQSLDECVQDTTAGEDVEPTMDDSVISNSARSWSESLAKLEAVMNPKLSESEVRNLDAIKNYVEDHLRCLTTLHSSLNISPYSHGK